MLLRPAVAGRESNSGKLSIPGASRTRFFTEFVEDSGSYGLCGITLHNLSEFAAAGVDFCRVDQVFHILEIDASFKTLRAAKRVQFHRDEMERTWNEEVKTVADV